VLQLRSRAEVAGADDRKSSSSQRTDRERNRRSDSYGNPKSIHLIGGDDFTTTIIFCNISMRYVSVHALVTKE
jgi:hypothetical protein